MRSPVGRVLRSAPDFALLAASSRFGVRAEEEGMARRIDATSWDRTLELTLEENGIRVCGTAPLGLRGPGHSASALLVSALIHRSAWNRNSQKFAKKVSN